MLKKALLFLVIVLNGCRTDGIEWNRLDRLSDFPYTNGHRWIGEHHAPSKGNCLTYALAVQKAFAQVGVPSRIITVQPDSHEVQIGNDYFWNIDTDFLEHVPHMEWRKGSLRHAFVVYRADNGKIHLVDNNVEMPILAKGSTDEGWAQQMMPPFVKCQIIDHNYK